ncbi:fam-b protein [Plasmodium chabaudi chabaudi]|uniref:Fam-b protein n=1 Tax=Plasmodium chabaudi chabaudi TaxID=31271 RepID=A0A1D3L8B2_PLACU|nr:fam-b protein [Plasmodium chabaudi chabaudi]
MRASILKYVFFSIIICSFEYAQNELYFINERNIYLERNIINLINNRILAGANNQFDLYDFYQSTSSIASQFNDYNADEKDIIHFRNIIDSHIKKHKENNTLPNLNNADKKTKKLIYELQKELEETKKGINNIRINELVIQLMQDKKIIKKYENISISEHEDFKHLENEGHFLKIENYNFEDKYHEITSSDAYEEIKTRKKFKKEVKKFIMNSVILGIGFGMAIASASWYLILLCTPQMVSMLKSYWKAFKYHADKQRNTK